MSDEEDEELLPIEDPRVPQAVRDHALRFRTPVRYAISYGNGEYLLAGADGEVIDLLVLRE